MRRCVERPDTTMLVVEYLYLAATAVLVVSGFTMVGMAAKAYLQTARHSMIYISVGFGLIAVGAFATAVSAFATNFEGARSLLLVNSGLSSVGLTCVVYSLIVYD